MIDAETAMRQAALTAEVYALKGAETYEKIFGHPPAECPSAASVFIGHFMRAAAHDFDVAIRENQS